MGTGAYGPPLAVACNDTMVRQSNEEGFAMVLAIFLMAILISVTAAALRMGQSDIIASRNYRSAAQALSAAGAGVNHSIMIINQGGIGGIVSLQSDIYDAWPNHKAPFAASPQPMPQLASFSYDVTLAMDPLYPGNANRGVLTAVGTGSDNSSRTVVARIVKSGVPAAPAGAVYLATDDASNSTFQGNSFAINGTDTNMNGTAGPAPAVPGLTARTAANAQETRNSLDDQQKDNVRGLGYLPGSPATPSVAAAQGMTTSQINQMINDLLALPHCTDTSTSFNSGHPSSCPNNFGTRAAPQITYLPGNGSGVTMGNGNINGYGILIVENALTINGNLDFYGLIIVRGTTQVTDVSGSVNVYGSIWTTDFNLTVGGHAAVQYSSEALALADTAGGAPGTLPAPVVLTAWRDVF